MRSVLFFLFLMWSFFAQAQQLPLQSQFNDLQGVINPAAINTNYTKNGYGLNFGINHRTQWTGIPNSPKTSILQADYLFESDPVGLVFGGHIVKDKVSRVGVTGFYGKIAAVFSDDLTNGGLSVGLSGGLVQYSVDTRNAKLIDVDDEALSSINNNKLYPDVGLGVSYFKRIGKNDDLIYGGLSVPQIFGLDLAYRNEDNNFNIKRVQHYYAQLGYLKNIGKEASYLEFSSWVKYVNGAPLNIDANLKYQITSIFFLTGGVNTSGLFNGQVGMEFDDVIGNDNVVRLTYGFNAPFFGDSPQFGNAHEIGLSIGLDR